MVRRFSTALGIVLLSAGPALAAPFLFSTGDPDGKIGVDSRGTAGGASEIESADDFTAPDVTLTGATFKGILTGDASGGTVGQVRVEIYRIFPLDSQDPPSGNVPTRVNSPADNALFERDSAVGDLLATTNVLSPQFAVQNSVLPGGIHAGAGGNGAQTGREVEVTVSFDPISLPAGHYFFVPQVQAGGGEFLWLSAPKPIVAPGTATNNPDLQMWTRDAALAPDWLRVGTDIVAGEVPPTFNGTFTLIGQVVPEPTTSTLLLLGLCALARRRSRD